MPDDAGKRFAGTAHQTRAEWAAVDRFLAAEGLSLRCDDLFEDPDRQRLSALGYVVHDGRILMLRRHKEPFAGYWTAPGGKLLPGEDPREAVMREVREETGLTLERPRLRLACSETGVGPAYNWVLFVFRARPVVEGVPPQLLTGARPTDEGLLEWLPIDRLASFAIPDVDRRLLRYILAPPEEPPYHVKIRYAADSSVVDMQVRPLTRARGH